MKKSLIILAVVLVVVCLIMLVLRTGLKQNPDEFRAQAVAMMKSASLNFDNFNDFWAQPANQADAMEEVIIRFQTGEEAWIINDGEATALESVPYPNRSHEIAHYAFPTIDGQKAVDFVTNPLTKESLGDAYDQFPLYMRMMGIVPTLPVQFGPITAVHEAFHEYVQTEPTWGNTSDSLFNRTSLLPLDTKPRTLRTQLAKTLKRAWQEPKNRDELLSQSRAIWDTYNQEYADEAARVREVDIVEGTAEWVGYAFSARSLVGWDAPKERVQAQTTEYVNLRNSTLDDLGGESYELGLFAGLLLDEIHQDNAIWQLQANTIPLTEILLKDVTPAEKIPTLSEDELSEIQNRANRINALHLEDANTIVNIWNSGQEDMIAMDSNSFFNGESVGYNGNYIVEGIPEGMSVGVGFSFDSTQNGIMRPIRGTVLLTDSIETPCGINKVVMAKSSFPSDFEFSSASKEALQNGGTLICLD